MLTPAASPADNQHMERNALLVVRNAVALGFCVVLGISAPATAQPQATLEVLDRQGDYYWVVETAVDGSRKGGWVSAQVPLDGIDRNALRPIPSTGPVQAAPPPAALPDATAAVAPQPPAITKARVAQPPSPGSGAKAPLARRGFWFSAGLGVGLGDCDTCVKRETGPTGGLSLGGSIGDHVLLGVGTAGWAKYLPDEEVTVSGGILDFRVRVYPVASSGFFLTGGLGVGGIAERADFSAGPGVAAVTYSETGAGALFGIGWDLRVGRNVSLTPFYNGFAVSTETFTGSVAQFGLGITIH